MHYTPVAPNLFRLKIYFSSCHHTEVYQSSVNIAKQHISFSACSN